MRHGSIAAQHALLIDVGRIPGRSSLIALTLQRRSDAVVFTTAVAAGDWRTWRRAIDAAGDLASLPRQAAQTYRYVGLTTLRLQDSRHGTEPQWCDERWYQRLGTDRSVPSLRLATRSCCRAGAAWRSPISVV